MNDITTTVRLTIKQMVALIMLVGSIMGTQAVSIYRQNDIQADQRVLHEEIRLTRSEFKSELDAAKADIKKELSERPPKWLVNLVSKIDERSQENALSRHRH